MRRARLILWSQSEVLSARRAWRRSLTQLTQLYWIALAACVPSQPRQAFLFDDSFEHEVWNEGSAPRLVFIFDLWHPQLRTDSERLAVLDATGQARYRRTTASLRAGRGLPYDGVDMIADRRERVVY